MRPWEHGLRTEGNPERGLVGGIVWGPSSQITEAPFQRMGVEGANRSGLDVARSREEYPRERRSDGVLTDGMVIKSGRIDGILPRGLLMLTLGVVGIDGDLGRGTNAGEICKITLNLVSCG